MIGKSNTKHPITSDPIKLSYNHESPHKNLSFLRKPSLNLLLALRITLKLKEDNPSTHKNICKCK
jgi:hypothetical protein